MPGLPSTVAWDGIRGKAGIVPAPVKLYISYAKDNQRQWLLPVRQHLLGLQRVGLIEIWEDSRLDAGGGWDEQIAAALEGADIIVLLVSSAYTASEYCYREMTRALERRKEGSAEVLWIYADHCDYEAMPFAALEGMPKGKDGRLQPLVEFSRKEQTRHLADATKRILRLVTEIAKAKDGTAEINSPIPSVINTSRRPVQSIMKSQAFLSYTRLDDRGHDGGISVLREALELQVQIVTGDDSFEIFQDVDGIAFGEHWPKRLDQALAASRFLIPVLSPRFFRSEPCRDELRKFLAHEQSAGRSDLILPIYLVEAAVLELPHLTAADELAAAIAQRQRWDWRPHAFAPPAEPAVRKAIRDLAVAIARRLEA